MLCSNCGNKLDSTDRFCQKCGTKVLISEGPEEKVEKPATTKISKASKVRKVSKVPYIMVEMLLLLAWIRFTYKNALAMSWPLQRFATAAGVVILVMLILYVVFQVKYRRLQKEVK